MGKTLFEKIWDRHVVQKVPDGPEQLYIDRLYCHEVTSAQAFEGLRQRNIPVFRPDKVFCMPDHNIPTLDQDREIADPVSRKQVETLKQNAAEYSLPYFGIMHEKNGIVTSDEKRAVVHRKSREVENRLFIQRKEGVYTLGQFAL